MKSQELDILLNRARDDSPKKSKTTNHIFDIFVEITLLYRDQLKEKGKTLTVADTHSALDGFMWYLRTKEIPRELGPKITQLIEMWVQHIPHIKRKKN